MNIRRAQKKKIAIVCISGLILFLLARSKTNKIKFEYKVDHADPMVVWEYVADFSNMKQLNPTIINFDIISEKGNYDHWEYITEYTEHLSQLPFIKNNNEGHFVVKPDGNEYLILSHHKTCFFYYFCVKSDSEFRFSIDSGKTNCTELVTYECPSLLTSFCRKEVTFQRQEIKANLQQHFSRINL